MSPRDNDSFNLPFGPLGQGDETVVYRGSKTEGRPGSCVHVRFCCCDFYRSARKTPRCMLLLVGVSVA